MTKKNGIPTQAEINKGRARVPPAEPTPPLSPPAWREGSPEWQRALDSNGGVWPTKSGG